MLITIDPNVRGCGVAGWAKADGTFLWAAYVKNPYLKPKERSYARDSALAEEVYRHCVVGGMDDKTVLIIERPRVYPGMPQTDLNDLIDVATVGAAVAAYGMAPMLTVFPSEWKGQVPKKTMLSRIWEKLTPEERLVVQKTNKSDTEDILDAIGIGLWHFGRLNITKYPGAEP